MACFEKIYFLNFIYDSIVFTSELSSIQSFTPFDTFFPYLFNNFPDGIQYLDVSYFKAF